MVKIKSIPIQSQRDFFTRHGLDFLNTAKLSKDDKRKLHEVLMKLESATRKTDMEIPGYFGLAAFREYFTNPPVDDGRIVDIHEEPIGRWRQLAIDGRVLQRATRSDEFILWFQAIPEGETW